MNFVGAFAGGASNEHLKAYAGRFFAEPDLERLQKAIQLTGIVATEDVRDVGALLVGNREEELERFLQSLWERGFKQSPRSTRLYYHPGMPDVRFVIAKHVVRFEKKVNGDWRLWESYLMTREHLLALKVIENPERHFSNRRSDV